jgi:hypothetical protein
MTGAWRPLAAAALALALAPLAAAATAATKGSTPAPRAAPASAVVAAVATSAAASAPAEFAGELAAGASYVGDFFYDANALRTWRPVKDVQVDKNSAWTIAWTNLAQFPALASATARAKPQQIRFTVLQVEVSSGAPTMPWSVVYRCEIQAVVKPVAPAPLAGKRR